MPRLTAKLAESPLFQTFGEALPLQNRIELAYKRTKAVVQTYKLTGDDIHNLSPKYWEFHTDPILAMDMAMGTLLTIHYNLCAGTLAKFAPTRPDVAQVLEKILSYDISGQYCLTELGHGLDAIHLATTATLLPHGGFELNTPAEHAAKFMPPTTPCGIPVVAVVFARLIIDKEDRGIKPFMVTLSDGKEMSEGIIAKQLISRGGSRPIGHALTYFHHVHLPSTALLGDTGKAPDPRAAFFDNISRVITGTLSMGGLALSAMRISSVVAGRYSLRRTVTDAATGGSKPILAFSTQYTPIVTAIGQTFVMEAFADYAHDLFVKTKNPTLRHFIATVFKATIMQHTHYTNLVLGDRCGAQGLFEVNQMSVLLADMRGAAIAEGDVLTISIRFAMEVLLGKVQIPTSSNPQSLLARHEQSIIADLRSVLASSKHHRSEEVQSIVLPQCQSLIEAIGHRMAYDSAIAKGIDPLAIEVYVASVVKLDPAWYAENNVSLKGQRQMQQEAVTAAYPHVEEWLAKLDVDHYVVAPISSDARWNAYVASLKTFGAPTELVDQAADKPQPVRSQL